MSIYDFTVKNHAEEDVQLSDYKGKVLLIVNTASKCGFTPQYDELQDLYDKYGKDKFEVLAFPCNQFGKQEPGDASEIKSFCTTNFNITFPILGKVDVNGKDASPLFEYLKKSCPGLLGNSVKWNFTKFLIDAEGKPIKRYASKLSPKKISADIEKLLK